MNTLYEIIKQIQEASGSKAKQALLDQYKEVSLLKSFLRAVYDPALSYYMKDINKYPESMGSADLGHSDIKFMIEQIAERDVTGKAAINALRDRMEPLNVQARELIRMIIKRSIGGSVGETMVLKTFPGLFFVPPYMRCATMDDKALAEYAAMQNFYVQTKMDGQFVYATRGQDGTAKLFTRAGSYYPPSFASALLVGSPRGYVVMGELVVYKLGTLLDRKTGNGILNSILHGDEALSDEYSFKIVAWDMVKNSEFDEGKSTTPLSERWENLKLIASGNIELVETDVVSTMLEAYSLNSAKIAQGKEGSVVKNPNGMWRNSSSGTRDAVKLKLEFEADFVITGAYEGAGKATGMLGGFDFATTDGRIKSSVGSGFSDAQRKEYWELLTAGGMSALNGSVITIKANDIISRVGSSNMSLFLPIFIEIRLDKTVGDSYDWVVEQFLAAKQGKAIQEILAAE